MKIKFLLVLFVTIILSNCGANFLPVFVGWDGNPNSKEATGYKDGLGNEAKFKQLKDFTIDKNGNLFVIDDNKIRKITPEGIVSTFAGDKEYLKNEKIIDIKLENPMSIAIDKEENLYITEKDSIKLTKITPKGIVSKLEIKEIVNKDGKEESIPFKFNPAALEINKKGDIFLIKYYMNVYKIENGIAKLFLDTSNKIKYEIGEVYDLNTDSENNIFVSLWDNMFSSYSIFFNSKGENIGFNSYIKSKYPDFKNEKFMGCCMTIDEEDNLYIADPDQSIKNNKMPLGTRSIYKFGKDKKNSLLVSNAVLGDKLKILVDSKRKSLYVLYLDFMNIDRIKLEEK